MSIFGRATRRTKNWLTTEDPELGAIHIHPRNDKIEHVLDADGDCICGPAAEHLDTLVYRWMYTHHALDGRELKERQAPS